LSGISVWIKEDGKRTYRVMHDVFAIYFHEKSVRLMHHDGVEVIDIDKIYMTVPTNNLNLGRR